MKVRPIPAKVLNAYVTVLSAYVPEITPTKLVAALKAHECEAKPVRNTPQMLTLKEAGKALKLSVWTLRRMADDGRIKARKVGQQWRIPLSEIEAMSEGREG